jgi:hypothetical protein
MSGGEKEARAMKWMSGEWATWAKRAAQMCNAAGPVLYVAFAVLACLRLHLFLSAAGHSC